MKLDRALQRKILMDLSDTYPNQDLPDSVANIPEDVAVANMQYLYEHGLIAEGIIMMLGGPHRLRPTKITAKGLDFIQDDGGLSAIFSVVTVRLDTEQFRALLATKIAQSSLPADTKKSYLDHLKDLPAEMLSQAAKRALDLGLDQLPELGEIIGKIFAP